MSQQSAPTRVSPSEMVSIIYGNVSQMGEPECSNYLRGMIESMRGVISESAVMESAGSVQDEPLWSKLSDIDLIHRGLSAARLVLGGTDESGHDKAVDGIEKLNSVREYLRSRGMVTEKQRGMLIGINKGLAKWLK